MSAIRVSAKAVIIKGGKILLLKHEDKEGGWYALPGGGQNHSETLSDALVRECREETGADVTVGEVIFIRDYIADNHEFKDEDPDAHQVEIMFECSLAGDYVAQNGAGPDTTQKEVTWMEVTDLHNYRFYPKELVRHLQDGRKDDGLK